MRQKTRHIGLEQGVRPFGGCYRQMQLVHACAAVITVIRTCVFGQNMHEQIVSCAARQAIAARAAAERVITCASIGGVIGGTAKDDVITAAQVNHFKFGKGQMRFNRRDHPRLAARKGKRGGGGHCG